MASRFHRWLALALGLATAGSLAGQVVWNGGTSTAWATGANWAGGAAPAGTAIARFNADTVRDPSVTTPVSVGALEFTATSNQAIGGTSTLTLNGVGGAGVTNDSGVAHAIAPVIALGGSQTWTTTGAGSNLSFDRSIALGANTLAIDAGTGTTVSVSTGNGDIVSGTGGIVKNGVGTLTFGAAVVNTFSGGLTVNTGTVTFAGNGALGTGPLALAGGTLTSAGTGTRTLANALDLSNTSTIAGASGRYYVFSSDAVTGLTGSLAIANQTGSGATSAGFSGSGFTLNAAISFADAFGELRLLNPAGTQQFAGTISGDGLVRRNAAGGTTLLAGDNTYTGGTVLAAGTLALGHDRALGTGALTLGGGTLTSAADRTLANPLTFAGVTTIAGGAGVDFTFTTDAIGGAAGSLALVNSDAAGRMTVALTGTGFTFGRTIAIDANSQLRLGNASGTQTFAGAISGAGTIVRDVAGGTSVLGNNAALTGGVTLAAGTIAANNNSALGTGTFTFAGGTLAAFDITARTLANAVALTGDANLGGAANLALSGPLAQSGSRTLLVDNTGATTLSGATLTLAEAGQARTLTLDIAAASGGLTISSVIQDGAGAGASGLVKNGAGALTLSGANTYTGGTALNAGTVTIGDNAAFGTGGVTLNGARLATTADRTLANGVVLAAATEISGATGVDFVFGSSAIATPAGALAVTNPSATGMVSLGFSGTGFDFSRPIDLGANTELRALNTSGTQTFSGAISGTGAVRVNGAGGTVVLAGDSTYTGATSIVAGTLRLGGNGSAISGPLGAPTAGTTVSAGAALDLAGYSLDTAEPVTLNGAGLGGAGALLNSGGAATYAGVVTLGTASTIGGSGDMTLAAALAGTAALTKAGAGTLTLAADSARTGGAQIDAGAIRLASPTALGATAQAVTLNGGTLALGTDTSASAYALTVSANSTIVSDKATAASAGITHALGGLALDNASTLTVARGANVGSGTAGVAFGATTLGATGATFAVDAGASLTVASIDGNTRSFTATGAGDMTVTGGITTTTGGVTKAGAGTLTLAGASTFSGATTIDSGVVSLQHNSGLGSVAGATTVSGSGAALELSDAAHGSLTTLAEPLYLNGTGVNGNGALRNAVGANTYAGLVTLNSAASIAANAGTALTLSLGVTSANQPLTIGTAANTGSVTLGGALNLGSGALAKDGAGTLTLNAASNTAGDVNLNGGTLALGAGAALNAKALNAGASATLTIGSGGAVNTTLAAGTTAVFSGQLAGSGTLAVTGADPTALLVFDHGTGFDASSLSLTLSGGTVRFSGGGTFAFASITITGDTVLDFGNSAGTVLTSTELVIGPGVQVTVNNWIAWSNAWFATGTVNGVALAGSDLKGTPPFADIHFNDAIGAWGTSWVANTAGGWSHEIRPTPEPAAYGALLLAASTGLLAWRRRRGAR